MSAKTGANGKVKILTDGRVAELRFINPEKRNCFSLELTEDLHELTTYALERDETDVLLVTSEGPIFCAGADRHLMEGDDDNKREKMLSLYNKSYERLREADIPVIVGASGAAIGAGASLLCWVADIRIIGEDIKIWWAGGNYGLVPLELAVYLKNEIGAALALELTLLGKHRKLTATEAKNLGLVNRVIPSDKVDEEARKIANLVTDIDSHHNVSEPLLKILRSTETEQIGEVLEMAQQKQSIGQATTARD